MRRILITAIALVVVLSSSVCAQVAVIGRGNELDGATRWTVGMSGEHHKIHEGNGYRITSIVTNDTLIIAFKTPNTTSWMHAIIDWGSEGAAVLAVLEGPTWDDSTGVRVPIYNRNRNSANTSGLLEDSKAPFAETGFVIRDPNGLSGGTDICPDVLWAVGKTGVSTRGQGEFIAKQNTAYAIFLLDGGASGLNLNIRFYMHTNK